MRRKKLKPKRGPGAPSALTDEREKVILETIRVGATFTAAARLAGVSVDTIHEWRRRGAGAHPTRPATPRLARFARAVDEALGQAEQVIVERIHVASVEDWRAGAWLLERRHPDAYGVKAQLEHSGAVTTAASAWDPSKYTTEELEQIASIQRAAAERRGKSSE
jgi:transposase